mmetsp:Transcript_963/g.3163  ORF Transcript_963/g.3163 Transcript_963/m.3163 type:complete len:239 (-) Transcript_963:2130-2846(-)
MVAHGTISSASFVACGTSCSTSTAFRNGMSTFFMPFTCAAMSFSFKPPTGNTKPRSETSPVIATSLLIGLPENKLTSAQHIATPADGPSFGIAPCGKWMCTLRPRNNPSPPNGGSESIPFATMRPYDPCVSADADAAYIPPPTLPAVWFPRSPLPPPGIEPPLSPSANACDCTQESAMRALSFMTSPSCPVSCRSPFPGITAASMYIKSPPAGVQERPATTPGIAAASVKRKSEFALS